MSRPRHFNFSDTTLRDARKRQGDRCGYCGERLPPAAPPGHGQSLFHEEKSFGHHVIPDQSGRVDDPADSFLRTVDNCVVLCHSCHHMAHNENTQTGAVAPPDWFKCSHGKSGMAEHQAWAIRVANEWRRWDARLTPATPTPTH